MSETQLSTVVAKPTTIEILAQGRAEAAKRKADSGSGKAVGTGAEENVGRSRLAEASTAALLRAKLLQAEFPDLEEQRAVNYPDSMRRFIKFQSMAGVLNLCLLSEGGFPTAKVVSRNPHSTLSISQPKGAEIELIQARANAFLTKIQGRMSSDEYTLLAKLNKDFAALQGQGLGPDIEQKISDINLEIKSLTEKMLNPEILAQSTFVKLGETSRVWERSIDSGFEIFTSRDDGGWSNEVYVRANPYYCAQLDPREEEEAKKQLKSIFSKSWTLLSQIETLGIGRSGIPAVMAKVAGLRKSVLTILQASDNLLLQEVQEINAARN